MYRYTKYTDNQYHFVIFNTSTLVFLSMAISPSISVLSPLVPKDAVLRWIGVSVL